MPNEVKRAAGYIRVSTAEQVQKGVSIETQEAEIRAYIKAHGMKLENIYIDRGITARKSLEKRVEFMKMMRAVEAGEIDHIVVLRLDRFFRNVYDYHKMMNEYLTPNHCDWSAVKEQYTTTTTNGRLMINLRLSIAEQECDTDSDRIKDVHQHQVNQGFVTSGSHPIGMKIVNKKMVHDEETKHIALDMFEHFEATNSVRGTMYHINSTYNLSMIYASVNKALRNPIYCGRYRNNKNFCEPLISEERFNNIQKMLSKNIKVKQAPETYIFTSLLECAHCGATLAGNCTHKGGISYKYYRCPKRSRDYLCDNTISINEKQVEKYLLDNVEALMEEHIYKAKKTQERESPRIKSNRKAIENKLERLNELYVNGFISMEKYKQDYADLQSKIVDVPEEQKIDLTATQKFLASDFIASYDTLSEAEKRSVWRRVIKRIKISGKEITEVDFL